MFRDKFKVSKQGNKLNIDYFAGRIMVDVKSDKHAHEYLMQQVENLDKLKSKIIKEANKLIEKDGKQ